MKFYRQQKGLIVLMMVALVPLMLLFAGFIIDMAYRHTVKLELLNAADAGALAGALDISQGRLEAIASAENLVQEHHVLEREILLSEMTIDTGIWDSVARTFTEDNTLAAINAIRVQISQQRDYFFSGIANLFTFQQSVTSIAYNPDPQDPQSRPRLVL